jgi:hypothetical protein
VAGVGGVHRVFGEDHGVVVGEGDAFCAVALRGFGNHLRAGLIHQSIHVARLGEVPVLAELAGEVAAGGAEGEDARSRVEVVERLLLDRVDAETGAAAIGGEDHLAAPVGADKAGGALAVVQLAVARAEVALDAAIFQRVPPAGGGTAQLFSASFHFCTS